MTGFCSAMIQLLTKSLAYISQLLSFAHGPVISFPERLIILLAAPSMKDTTLPPGARPVWVP